MGIRLRIFGLVIIGAAQTALGQMGPSMVDVAPVKRQAVELTQPLVASIEPVTQSTVAAEEGGWVKQRMFDEGQILKAGAVLAKLDTELLEADLEAAEAAHRSAASGVEQAKAILANSQRDLDRMKQLYERKVAPEKEYQDSITQHAIYSAVLATRQAELAEKQALVNRLELTIRKSALITPLAGVVARRYIELGEWIRQGDPVAKIVQLDPLFVRVNVPESVIARVRLGAESRVLIDAMPGSALKAKVEQILPTADESSRTFAVKLLLANPTGAVRPGFFARAVLTSLDPSDSTLVPQDSIITRGTEAAVVVMRQGKAQIVPVRRGASDGQMVAVSPIKGELSDQDLVVVRGNESLRGGESLIPRNLPPPGAGQPPATSSAPSAPSAPPAPPASRSSPAADGH